MAVRNANRLKTSMYVITTTLISLIIVNAGYAQPLPDSLSITFEAIKNRTDIGAVSYALVEGDKVVAMGGLGQRSISDTRPVTANTPIRIGSITKTFTALALMTLVEQDKLTLDLPIKELLPNIPLNNGFKESPVTLAMMLEHTAGLTDLTRKEFNYPSALSLKEAFTVSPRARIVNWRPGYYKSYTNAGAGYVSAAIEKVMKQDYDSWFNLEILKTLGMSHSQLHWSTELEKSLVVGYNADLKTQIPYWHTLFRAFGGLNTTAKDMSSFLKLMINNGSINGKAFLSPQSILRMETPQTTLASKQGLTLGYGLGIRSELYKGHRIYQHGGDADGYLAHFGYNKESKRGYFVVINAFRHDILRPFKAALNQWVVSELKTPVTPPIASVRVEHLEKLAGQYEKTTYRFKGSRRAEVEIKLEDNSLFFRRKGHKNWTRLIPVSNWLYRYEGSPEATLAFIQTDNGELHMQNGDESFMQNKAI